MYDPGSRQRLVYMVVGGISIYFGIQYFGVSAVALWKMMFI